MADNTETKETITADELAEGVQNLSIKEGSSTAGDDKKPRKRNNNNKKKEKTATEGEATDAAAVGEATENDAAAAPEYDNTAKVFVGNLSFGTTKEELEEYFGQAGLIKEINIITRGQRSMGYGFISFETDEDADKAVELLDKTELGGRQINVERAQDKEPGEVRRGGFRGRGRFGRGRGRGRFGYRGGYRGRYYRGGRGRGRGRYGGRRFSQQEGAARLDEEGAPAQDVSEDAGAEQGGEAGTGRGRGRRGRGRGGRRFSRGSRTPREPRDNTPSKTTIFVANLPFKVTDEDLSSIFKDYNVSSAHVVKLRSGRSKGFGFVEVANEEEQQKVLSELKNVVVDGRELVIKVAMAYQTPPQETEGEGEHGSGAAEGQAQ